MLVKNQLTFTNPITKGVIDEVRVQSEEPNFCFQAGFKAFQRGFIPSA